MDSTRRGKMMPDALAKTVPTWAAVINRLLFPDSIEYHGLCTSSDLVSRSEHSQIEARLSGFVHAAKELGLDLSKLRATISKPLQPFFTCPCFVAPEIPSALKALPVVLCSVSKEEIGDGDSYVQGGGDDTENWAHGLTADLFWRFKEDLLSASSDNEARGVINRITDPTTLSDQSRATILSCVAPPASLAIGTNEVAPSECHQQYDVVLYCNEGPKEASKPALTSQDKSMTLVLGCRTGKPGSRDLRVQLPRVSHLMRELRGAGRFLICCETGNDLAVGVALTVLCQWYTEDGDQRLSGSLRTSTDLKQVEA